MSDEQDIEREIQEKGLNAPRLTPESIDDKIQAKEFHMVSGYGYNITVCVIVLQNGFTTVGINQGPVSAANFDGELGQQLAEKDARAKIWPLEGYLLAEQLHNA